ncbi:MAG: hypothetical protein QHC90_15590 [Shinella sp.]|nr:hypothetical protein [Shinella sp.]
MTTKATSIWRKSLPTYAVICTSFALSACQTPEEQRTQDLQDDRRNCEAAGFAPGSNAMANCMDTAAAARSADKDRQAMADRQRQTEQAQRDADWDRQVQQTRDQTRADADAWRSGTGPYANQSFGTSGGNSDTTMPSAAGIDGMECTGTGDDAVCNAR